MHFLSSRDQRFCLRPPDKKSFSSACILSETQILQKNKILQADSFSKWYFPQIAFELDLGPKCNIQRFLYSLRGFFPRTLM